jgi:hypothetical protein
MRRPSLICCLFATVVALGFGSMVKADEPKSYADTYRVDALTAIGKVIAIEPKGAVKPLGNEELRMLQDIRSGNLQAWTTADVALTVAGIADRKDADQYRQQIDEITEEARDVVATAKTDEQKLKKLAKYLLKGPMKAGYVSGQYDLQVLLDTGTYNCASSAVLFDMIARRLGMKVEGVNRPGHVFCRYADFDIETTSGRVYPADIRDQRMLKKRTEKDGKEGTLYAHQLFLETSNRSLMCEPYYDEGVKLVKEKKYDRALISFLKACVVEPNNPIPARQMDSTFSHLCEDRVKKGQTKQAKAIVKLYRELLQDSTAADKLEKKLKGTGKKAA